MDTPKGKKKGHGKDKNADGRDKGYGKTAANKSDIVAFTAASKAAAGWRQQFRSRSRSREDATLPNWGQQISNPIRPPGRREIVAWPGPLPKALAKETIRPKPMPKALSMPKALEPESVDSSDASESSSSSDESNAGDASASSWAWQCERCNKITAAAELGDRCARCGKPKSRLLNDQASLKKEKKL